MINFIKKFPDAIAFLVVVTAMALFSLGDVPTGVLPASNASSGEVPTGGEDTSSNGDGFWRVDGLPGGDNFFLFAGIVVAVLIVLPSAILLISRLFTGSLERAGLWLRFFWASFFVSLVMLSLKFILYDTVLIELHLFRQFDGGLKDLFSFSLTLYAFVAGFILFYCLQEYSNISKDFKQELGAWHAMFDLLRFFERRPGDKVRAGFEEEVKENDSASKDGQRQIAQIDPVEMTAEGDPEAGLNRVFETLLRFTVVDDNDQPALDALIQKYSTLRVLLHQRKEKSVRSPSMLVFVVWVVAAINISLASLAVLSVFEFCHPKDQEAAVTTTEAAIVAPLNATTASESSAQTATQNPAALSSEATSNGATEDSATGETAAEEGADTVGQCIDGPVQALQRLVLSIFVSVIVLPIIIINLTIYDLRNPFGGDWKIDVENEYKKLFSQLAEFVDESEKKADSKAREHDAAAQGAG